MQFALEVRRRGTEIACVNPNQTRQTMIAAAILFVLPAASALVAPAARAATRRAPLRATVERVYNMPDCLDIPSDVPALDGLLGGDASAAPPAELKKGPSEFELNLGKCIDTLRMDVPEFADREFQWDIYTDDVELSDPQAVQARGLASYKQFFAMVRAFRRFAVRDVSVTYKLRYDWAGKRVIVTWYSEWTMKGWPQIGARPTHVDAVSYFSLTDEGFVYKHEVDRVQINGQMLSPPYGLAWAGVKRDMFDGLDAPVPAGAW